MRQCPPTGRARLSLSHPPPSLSLALRGIADLASDKPQDLDQALVLQAVQDLDAYRPVTTERLISGCGRAKRLDHICIGDVRA